jgi:hypothetical protein
VQFHECGVVAEDLTLEHKERSGMSWYSDRPESVLCGEFGEAEFDHVKHFAVVGTPKHHIIWSLLGVRDVTKHRTIGLLHVVFDLLAVLERANVMLPAEEHAEILLELVLQ